VEAEVKGQALDAVVTAVSTLAPATRMRVQTILEEHDALHVSPTEWYPLGEYIDTLEAIESTVGASVLRRVGMQLPIVTAGRVDAPDPGTALEGLAALYESNHRNAPPGGFEFRGMAGSVATVVSTTPYPDHFDRGVLDATFSGHGTDDLYATVTPTRGFGQDGDTVYEVRW
jgi:hypothetical protein